MASGKRLECSRGFKARTTRWTRLTRENDSLRASKATERSRVSHARVLPNGLRPCLLACQMAWTVAKRNLATTSSWSCSRSCWRPRRSFASCGLNLALLCLSTNSHDPHEFASSHCRKLSSCSTFFSKDNLRTCELDSDVGIASNAVFFTLVIRVFLNWIAHVTRILTPCCQLTNNM
jgi:hypothetical protein